VTHQGGEPDPERENVKGCKVDKVLRRHTMAVWFPVLWTFAAVIGLVRHSPDFRRLPASVPLTSTAARIIVHGVLLFVVVTVGTVLINYLFYDPATDPQGQFHIWVWGGGLLYAAALTPVVTVFTVWINLRRRTRPCDFEIEERYHQGHHEPGDRLAHFHVHRDRPSLDLE